MFWRRPGFSWTIAGTRSRPNFNAHRQRPYEDILAELLHAGEQDGSNLSNAQIQAIVVHMYFAAYGNTYRTLTLFCMSLAQNPDVMERARSEILDTAPDGPVDIEILGRLKYLDQVTKEVRRYHRIFAATFFDRVTEPFEFQGYQVPKGWKAVGGIYATMQDTEVFTNPDRFGPGRAEDLRQENSYIPQGGGPMDGHR